MEIKYVFIDNECECGCGQIVNPGRKFVNHHNPPWNKDLKGSQIAWNKNLTKETDERVAKYSLQKVGKKRPDMKGKNNPCFKTENGLHHSCGKPSWNAGLTKETNKSVAKISKSLMGKPSWNAGLTKETHESLQKISIALSGEKNPFYGQSYWYNKPKEQQPFFNKHHTKKSNDQRRKTMEEKWQDPEFQLKMIEALNIHPNKPESFLLNLLNELYPGKWEYVGDFTFWVNGRNPDFINCNGQKKIIEIYGDYWHAGQNPEDRKDIFREFGYETLIFWESELKDMDYVLFQLEEFMKL